MLRGNYLKMVTGPKLEAANCKCQIKEGEIRMKVLYNSNGRHSLKLKTRKTIANSLLLNQN